MCTGLEVWNRWLFQGNERSPAWLEGGEEGDGGEYELVQLVGARLCRVLWSGA